MTNKVELISKTDLEILDGEPRISDTRLATKSGTPRAAEMTVQRVEVFDEWLPPSGPKAAQGGARDLYDLTPGVPSAFGRKPVLMRLWNKAVSLWDALKRRSLEAR